MENKPMTFSKFSAGIYRIATADGTGSGFCVTTSPYIITNFHVVSGFKDVSVEEAQTKKRFKAHVVYINPKLDIAFLSPSQPAMSVLDCSTQMDLKKGETVHVMGYPLGMPFSISKGVISSEKQMVNSLPYIQTDAAINPGNSGGPMLNQHGQVVGIVTCKYTQAENMGFALPASYIHQAMKELSDYAKGNSVADVVVCPSCDGFLVQKTDHCDNCGSELNSSQWFDAHAPSPLALFVEDSLQKIQIDPITARAGRNYWEFWQGSAVIRIFVCKDDYLFASSRLVKLPKKNIKELYTYLLSFNERPFYMDIYESDVYLSYRTHLSDVFNATESAELKANFGKMIQLADRLDNELITKFECEPSQDTNLSQL